MNKKSFTPYIVLVLFFSSCSLKYGMQIQDEDTVPEFVFSNVNFDRYEDNNKVISLNASKIEQYKDGKSMYAKDLNFTIKDKDGNIKTEGKCNLLSADTDQERYSLYNDIEIQNKEDDVIVNAKTLKWNGKSEQLTSNRNDEVTIKKGDTVLTGKGFSASGINKQYAFTGSIKGTTQTDTEEEGALDENTETIEE